MKFRSECERAVDEQGEEQLNRLTAIGWLLIVVHAAIFAVVGPLIAVNFIPRQFLTIKAMVATILATGGPSFLLCKWLLEKQGIIVIRPAQPKAAEQKN